MQLIIQMIRFLLGNTKEMLFDCLDEGCKRIQDCGFRLSEELLVSVDVYKIYWFILNKDGYRHELEYVREYACSYSYNHKLIFESYRKLLSIYSGDASSSSTA